MNDETEVRAQRRRSAALIEQIVAGFADSGLNRTEFCRRHGMGLGTLNRYLKQRREESDAGEAHSGLVAVELAGVWRWCYPAGAGSKSEQALTSPPCSGWSTC